MHDFLAHDVARARVAEMEFLEQPDGRLALHEGVERDLQVAAVAAEFERLLDQRAADAAAAKIVVDAQPPDLPDALLVLLHADHADDVGPPAVAGRGCLGDPEVRAGAGHVGGLDVVDVDAGVVLRHASADQAVDVELRADRQVLATETANGEGDRRGRRGGGRGWAGRRIHGRRAF
jgi:hypothetical protein